MPLTEHVINNLIHANAIPQPYPPVLTLIHLFQGLGFLYQIRPQPVRRNVSVIRVDVDTVWAFFHLMYPFDNFRIRVLWRVKQIDHLKIAPISSGKGGGYVQELILSLPVIKELCQLIQDDQLYGIILINDTFRVINTIRAGKVDSRAMLLVSDLHGRFGDLEGRLRNLQPVQPPQHFLVHRLPQLVMALAQYHYGASGIRYQLIDSLNRRIAGFRAGTAGGQDDMLIGPVVEYPVILRDDDSRNPYLLLFLVQCHLIFLHHPLPYLPAPGKSGLSEPSSVRFLPSAPR